MTNSVTPTESLREARDRLRTFRTSYDEAVSSFRWPDVGRRSTGPTTGSTPGRATTTRPGLVVVEEDGSGGVLLRRPGAAVRPGRVATCRPGVGRGDSVIVMLGNQVELWETMLAIIKLGAVVMPTTTAVGPADLVDRMARGRRQGGRLQRRRRRQVRRGAWRLRPVVVGSAEEARDGWVAYAAAYDAAPEAGSPLEHPGNATTDRMLLYFTSGTTSRPKLVEHTHRTYPVGHLSTMYWLGLEPGDVHLNISSPGMGEARLVELLRAVAGRGDGARLQLRPLRPGGAARPDPARGRDDVLRAAHRVADADQRRPDRRSRRRCVRRSRPASRSTRR